MPDTAKLRDLAAVFLKLGFTAFGGPAAHVAMMHDEVVKRRQWLTDQEYLDLMAAANLIPGPNSTETAIHVGASQAGWPGLLVAGLCFILPAMGIVMVLAWAYVAFGTLPAAEWLLYGVKPVIIAIIAQAIWGLGRKAVKGWLLIIITAAVLIGYFLGVDSLILLLGAALLVMLIRNAARLRSQNLTTLLVGARHALPLPAMLTAAPFSLGVLFLTFLKIGAVLYGGGYTLLAFLHTDFVDRLGWLTEKQLIDAVAVGQVTPGPLFTTATFIGYTLAARSANNAILPGIIGGTVATLGIFLPSFILVAITHPIIPKLRQSAWAGAFLDGANAASVGLMAAVTLVLARAAFLNPQTNVPDPLAIVLGIAAAIALIRFNVNSFWLVMGGAAVGLIASLVR